MSHPMSVTFSVLKGNPIMFFGIVLPYTLLGGGVGGAKFYLFGEAVAYLHYVSVVMENKVVSFESFFSCKAEP